MREDRLVHLEHGVELVIHQLRPPVVLAEPLETGPQRRRRREVGGEPTGPVGIGADHRPVAGGRQLAQQCVGAHGVGIDDVLVEERRRPTRRRQEERAEVLPKEVTGEQRVEEVGLLAN